MDRHFNGVAIACEGFVNRIIYYFINKMVKADLARRADVHRGSFPHRVTAFENRN
jgi:hypothetical protein